MARDDRTRPIRRTVPGERHHPAVLPELTDDDLRELDLSLGHRRLLLRAIKDLAGSPAAATAQEAGVPTTAPASATPRQRGGAAAADGAVLRPGRLDRAGGAARSRGHARGDRARIRTAAPSVIARFEGFVAKFMGDGVLAYFGYPQAHEDDAERAVRAGLALAASGRRAEGARRRSAGRPGRHRDRARGGRRSDRRGRGAGAGGGRRDPQPRGALAGAGRARAAW